MPVPVELRTKRLFLRPWRAEDAPDLLPILEANWEHLGPWIPARVATPAPIPELEARLAGFGQDFMAAREWRYGLFASDAQTVLGEIGLYPRNEEGRVAFDDADRIELGYWLRADVTGQGFITEAAQALLDVAAQLPHLSHVEIRCDARNAPSAAVPRRLGFALGASIVTESSTPAEPAVQLQVWTRANRGSAAW